VIDGYETPGGHKTEAKKCVMFEVLPPVLTLQMQRVAWINNALQKNCAKVVFEPKMIMDRWKKN
jgi:hypothetical protein